MKSAKSWALFLLGLATVVLIGYTVWLIFSIAFSWIGSQKPEVMAALMAAAATIFGSVFAVLLSQQRSKKREIAESHRQQKVDLYTPFIKKVMEQMQEAKKPEHQNDSANRKKFEKFFWEFTGDLVLWGSSGVVKSYLKWREASRVESLPDLLLGTDDLIRAMRKDLGHSDLMMARGDIVKLFLTDPDEIDKML